MTRQTPSILAIAALALALATPILAHAQNSESPVRTFPEIVGTWMLDREASTGRMSMAPPPSVSLTIATTPNDVTVVRVLDLPPERPGREGRRMMTNNPPPEVYRLNGVPTLRPEYPGGPDLHYSFALVADALALTAKRPSRRDASFTAVTDAISVQGDVLTLHRQLTSVNERGQIYEMREPRNNFRQTYIYRRALPPAVE